jgi:glycosyltransferase domain-containing protein
MTSFRNEITIICATYNRPHYIKRYIDYYTGTGIQVIIEDSSAVRPENIDFPPNIQYSWKPERTFTQKVYELTNQVQTPYMVLCSDDDFIIPEALDVCVEWLNAHSDYSAVQGQRMRLINKNGQNYYVLELRAEPYPGKQNVSNDPLDRVKYQFYPHADELICAVVRTENMRKTIAYCEAKLVKIDVIVLVLGVLSAAIGKTAVLPILYTVLSYIPNSSGTQSQHILEYNPEKMSEKQREELSEAIEYAARALSDVAYIHKEKARDLLEELFLTLQHHALNPIIQQFSEQNIVKRIARSCLPRPVYLLLGEYFKTQKLLQYLQSQLGTPYSNTPDRQYLKHISTFVEKHNSSTSIQVPGSKVYLAIRHFLIDRHFQA